MLNFDLEPTASDDQTKLTMTARYRPKGLIGILYWYAVVPFHNFVFGGMLRGIRKTAEKKQLSESHSVSQQTMNASPSSGYGRARLWLGISAVGTMVTLATLALAIGIPASLRSAIDASPTAQVISLLAFIILYGLIQLPFDFLGGYWLPKGYGRSHAPLLNFLANLLRGIATHSALLLVAAIALTQAGKYAGIMGVVAAGMALSLLLLQFRIPIAAMMARLGRVRDSLSSDLQAARLPVVQVDSQDEGFTGGITGVLRPRAQLLPKRWQEVLGPDGTQLAVSRRRLAMESGSWRRGRVVALSFTATGLLLAAWLVGPQLGTAWGTIQFSLWFSLWSFLGLLSLPTLSRRGVIEIDERAQASGFSSALIRTVTERLDRLQDGEPARPTLVETIFHPVPSVESRLEGPKSHQVPGYWDAARTSVYLSLSGLSLLGRAVHCNCGRPALWVFLPTD